MAQGFDISNITNSKLLALAKEVDVKNGNKNGKLDGDEVSIFSDKANLGLTDVDAGYIQDDINAVLGFSKSTPATTNPIALTKKETKRDKEAVKDTVKDLVKQGIAPQDLIKTLKEKYSNPQFASVIEEVEYVLNTVNSTNYNSKADVENIHKQAKAQLKADGKWDGFHKDLLDSIEDQAKANQINKEFKTLIGMYNDVKEAATKEGLAQNFEEYYNVVESKVDKKNSYTKEALKKLEAFAKDDARNVVADRMEDTTATGKKGIRKELRAQAGKDDFQKDAIQDMKTERKIFAREHKYEQNAQKLEHLTRSDVEKKLGTKMFDLLKGSYLETVKNEDGTYDLSKLGDEILTRVGADYKVNQSKDKQMAEMENIKIRLADLAQVSKDEISNGDVKDLLGLFKIKREHKDHTPGIVKALVGGASAAASGFAASKPIDVNQNVHLTFEDATMASDLMKELDKQGIDYTSTELTKGKVSININQAVSIDNRLFDTLRGLGIGVLTSAALDVILGHKRDEQSCMSVSDYDKNDPTYTDPAKYKKHFANTTKSQAKIQAMNALVDAYVEKYGENWHSELHQTILDAAGIGSKLNPEECRMLKFKKPVEPQAQKPSTEPDAPEQKPTVPPTVPEAKEDCHVEYREDIKMADSNKYTWNQIVNMYYSNCLGSHTALEITHKIKEYNHISGKVTYIPANIVLPADLFGDGECTRTERQDVKRIKVAQARRVVKHNGKLGDTGVQARNVCKNADGSYTTTDWSRRHKDRAGAEKEAKENGWIK